MWFRRRWKAFKSPPILKRLFLRCQSFSRSTSPSFADPPQLDSFIVVIFNFSPQFSSLSFQSSSCSPCSFLLPLNFFPSLSDTFRSVIAAASFKPHCYDSACGRLFSTVSINGISGLGQADIIQHRVISPVSKWGCIPVNRFIILSFLPVLEFIS